MVYVDLGASSEAVTVGCVIGGSAGGILLAALKIGVATHLSAGGTNSEVLKREDQGASGAYKGMYVVTEETQWVSGAMVDQVEGCKRQPRQGTVRGQI